MAEAGVDVSLRRGVLRISPPVHNDAKDVEGALAVSRRLPEANEAGPADLGSVRIDRALFRPGSVVDGLDIRVAANHQGRSPRDLPSHRSVAQRPHLVTTAAHLRMYRHRKVVEFQRFHGVEVLASNFHEKWMPLGVSPKRISEKA
jgi:hypothetical protein